MKLEGAKDLEEINKVLNQPGVQWMQRASCLKHPDKPGGCIIPCNNDIDSKQNISNFFIYKVCFSGAMFKYGSHQFLLGIRDKQVGEAPKM